MGRIPKNAVGKSGGTSQEVSAYGSPIHSGPLDTLDPPRPWDKRYGISQCEYSDETSGIFCVSFYLSVYMLLFFLFIHLLRQGTKLFTFHFEKLKYIVTTEEGNKLEISLIMFGIYCNKHCCVYELFIQLKKFTLQDSFSF